MDTKELAQTIAAWTQVEAAKGNMLPKTVEEIVTELKEKRGIVLGKKPRAYCRYLVWNPKLIEVGGTVVDPFCRRQGDGTRVNLETVSAAHHDHPQATIIGLTENSLSYAMVTKMGGVERTKADIDPIVWELCGKPGQECVHRASFPNCPCTPFLLTHLANNYGPNN